MSVTTTVMIGCGGMAQYHLTNILKVRSGKLKNPCPPEVGLRFAKLMEMTSVSTASGKPLVKEQR